MSDIKLPGGETSHVDTFARDNLPPREMWAEISFSSLPELTACPGRLNAADYVLDHHVREGRGGRRAFVFGGAEWTYAELQNRADRIARVLTEDQGLAPGNRVLLRGPNNPMMAATWLGVIKAGGVCVPTMPMLRARELAFVIDKARIRHALCDIALAEELDLTRERASGLETVSYFTGLGEGTDPRADLDGRIADKPAGFANVDTAADDVAFIAFTSGTTGQPKGTIHFHRDILAACECFPRHVFDARPEDVYTGSPPLAFTFGLGAFLCFPLRYGSSVVLVDKPSPQTLLEAIETHRCNTLYTAPTMYRAMLDLLADYDISSLEKCVSAGETLPKPTFDAFHDKTGIRIIDGIGSTEMLHIFIASSGDDIRPGATGKVVPGYEARILDDEGRPLPPGHVGHLAVRGPTVCRYLDDPERQHAYVKDGWNLPGDLYLEDEDGYYWYQGRSDDLIISAGYNISGPEVEAVLLESPKVKECAVVASPDPERGHIVKAFVVLSDPGEAGDTTASELQDLVKKEIAPYKYPRAVEFIDVLPRTQTGKVQRSKLRQLEEERARNR
ncbi:MAG: AMP-binding protein [Alphaproteobacteria bacterium]